MGLTLGVSVRYLGCVQPIVWKEFFNEQASRYDENPFTQHTVAEVDFLQTLFPLSRDARILDLGCGTGRHSIEFAKRGYRATGVDFSVAMLEVAQTKAMVAGVSPEWVCEDVTRFESDARFDLAITLCEGGFGLLSGDEEAEDQALKIFATARQHLKKGGGFVLTGLNGYSAIRRIQDEYTQSGAFDPVTMVAKYVDEFDLPGGKREVLVRERLFIPPEVVRLLRESGFRVDHVWGGTAGNWGRRPLMMDEVEAMYVCTLV